MQVKTLTDFLEGKPDDAIVFVQMFDSEGNPQLVDLADMIMPTKTEKGDLGFVLLLKNTNNDFVEVDC